MRFSLLVHINVILYSYCELFKHTHTPGRGQCQDFGAIENGIRVLDGTREGDMVAFQCNEGFDLLGYRQLTCESDDNWSGIWPACTMGSSHYAMLNIC